MKWDLFTDTSLFSFYSRPQYGLTGVPAGLTAIPSGVSGMPAGMTALNPSTGMPAGMAGVPAGVSGMQAMYATEKSAGLYPGGSPTYRLPQGSYLAAQPGTAQASYLAASQQPGGYLAVSSPVGQQRYMTMSQAYPMSTTVGTSPSLYTGNYLQVLPSVNV